MHDFVSSTYRNRSATTEDFKACMEKNMPPWMDIEQNHKLDWFFNAYVYGTEVPTYNVTSSFEKKGDETIVHFKLTQSGVSENFTMMVPLYIEFENKTVFPLGAATMNLALTTSTRPSTSANLPAHQNASSRTTPTTSSAPTRTGNDNGKLLLSASGSIGSSQLEAGS